MRRRAFSFLLIAGLTVASSASGCHLSGELTGDELTEAGAAASLDRSLCGQAIQDPTTGTSEATWSSLYRDYFGPTGRPGSCSLTNICHGANAEATKTSGYNNGAGIHCVDSAGCWQAFHDKELVTGSDTEKKNPAKANLFFILRFCNPDGSGTGIMPQSPVASFSASAKSRFMAWIAAGAPND